jgi:methionine aminopeptidase
VFGLKRKPKAKDRLPRALEEAIRATDGLPFARRTLLRHLDSPQQVGEAIRLLDKAKLLVQYPPLCEKRGVRVAQTEHTVFISEDGAEVLTRLP